MKKALLLVCGIWVSSTMLLAQNNTVSTNQPTFQSAPVDKYPTPFGGGVVRRDAGNAWFQPVDAARVSGETYTYYGDFHSWPDSLPVVRYSAGPEHAFCHGFGACLDPKADYYSPVLTRYNNYTVDSFYFRYKYYNPVNSHTDSFIIQVYDDTKFVALNFGVGNPSFSPALKGLRGVSSTREYKYLLDTGNNTADFFKQSSASFADIFIQELDPPISVRELDGTGSNRSGLFGFTTYMKPNYAYKFGDTMLTGRDTVRSEDPFNKISTIQPYVLQANTALEPSNQSFNYLLANYTSTRYSTRSSEWFQPGNPPSTARRYLDAGFHLNYFNLGTRFAELGADVSNIYPSPANNMAEVSVQIKLKKADNVKLDVYNTQGQLVKTIANKSFAAGTSTVTFNVENMASGAYFVKLQGAFGAVAQSFMVR